MQTLQSFPAIAGTDARILILGTMPGKMSLAQQQYYAHPRNAFWPIVGEIFGIDPCTDYAIKTSQLADSGVALWDVLQSCIRASSLDADIEPDSIVPNDIVALLAAHPNIRRVCFNGATAEKLFRRHIRPQLATAVNSIEYVSLPSTSPAHAGMNYAKKLRLWRAGLHINT